MAAFRRFLEGPKGLAAKFAHDHFPMGFSSVGRVLLAELWLRCQQLR
jgi:hypothetical protein